MYVNGMYERKINTHYWVWSIDRKSRKSQISVMDMSHWCESWITPIATWQQVPSRKRIISNEFSVQTSATNDRSRRATKTPIMSSSTASTTDCIETETFIHDMDAANKCFHDWNRPTKVKLTALFNMLRENLANIPNPTCIGGQFELSIYITNGSE